MSGVEAWITGHEALCAERYGGLKSDLRWLIRGVFGLLVGVVAWLAVQLWNGRTPAPGPAPPATVIHNDTRPDRSVRLDSAASPRAEQKANLWSARMRSRDEIEVLRLMETAVRAIQGRYHPGRPAFYALGRLENEIGRARREVAAQSPTASASEA